jgi:hypothetical protein
MTDSYPVVDVEESVILDRHLPVRDPEKLIPSHVGLLGVFENGGAIRPFKNPGPEWEVLSVRPDEIGGSPVDDKVDVHIASWLSPASTIEGH